jgi:hypothetical protein
MSIRDTYYKKQIADEEKYIVDAISDVKNTESDKIQILARRIMYFAGCMVHGANLASTELRLKQCEERWVNRKQKRK